MIHVNMLTDRDAGVCVANVTCNLRVGTVNAVGSSKCHPLDRFDQDTGEVIALTRALRLLAARLGEFAGRRVGASPITVNVDDLEVHIGTAVPGPGGQLRVEDRRRFI